MTIDVSKLSDADVAYFWQRVERQPQGCWEWTAGRATGGYGSAHYQHQRVAAHRLSWELANGEIPDGSLVLHRCDNPPCVNPAVYGGSGRRCRICRNRVVRDSNRRRRERKPAGASR